MVAGCAHAPIFLSHVNYAIHERLERKFKLFRVWRTVVDDDHFVVSKCLREDRLQGLADVRRDFISRHHDANAWPGIHIEIYLDLVRIGAGEMRATKTSNLPLFSQLEVKAMKRPSLEIVGLGIAQ